MTKEEQLALVESNAISDELTKILISTGALENSEGDVEKTAAWWQHAARGIRDTMKKIPGAVKGGAAIGGASGALAGASGKDGSFGKALGYGALGAAGGAGLGQAGHALAKNTQLGQKAVQKYKNMKGMLFADSAEGAAKLKADDAAKAREIINKSKASRKKKRLEQAAAAATKAAT